MTIESVEIPFLPYNVIGERARSFLEELGRSHIIPVDVEAIVEFDLGLDIIPIPGLQKTVGTEAFLSSNLKEISLDQFIMENRPHRYRFSLAHEIGHLKLHSQLYSISTFSSLDEWKEWHGQLNDDDRSWLETHANHFAGHLLVPTAHLRTKFFDLLAEAKEKIHKCADMGLPKSDSVDYALNWIADRVSPDFQVSTAVTKIRLQKENLEEHL